MASAQESQRRWSRRLIVGRVIGVVSLLIAAGLVYWVVSSFTSEVDALTRGSIPAARLDLRPGEQSVFLEGHLRHGIKACNCPAARRARATIEGPDGPVSVDDSPTNSQDYTVDNLDGVQIGAVNIVRPGRYTVRTETTVGNAVAIGHYSGAETLVAPMLVAIALFVLSGIGFSVAYNARRAARAARATG
jgi:ABC-type glycerol-3-phosphate transport system permease component